MAYRIEIADRAARDLEALYVEKNAAGSQAASRWYNGLEEAVSALAVYPHRCPAAPEARKLRRELRHLLYGKKPHVYRVIYEVALQDTRTLVFSRKTSRSSLSDVDMRLRWPDRRVDR